MFQALKKLAVRAGAAVVLGGVALVAHAQTSPTGPDFSQLTASIDLSTVITAVLAVAGIMVGVYVAIKGAKIVIGMLKGA
ncbi:hypothetical protein B0G84_6219 [Paraburkholderia sp. BL8N3]|nr:major capsid protein [Paraburkholderia sp. BL8N3]TCK37164.1 hypothetical protein B0G84_6219 [Paraburkholderia sp. BL8N3]